MEIGINNIAEIVESFGVQLSYSQKAAYERYAELLIQWNEKINLTAITEPKQIGIKHFLDCLMIFKNADIPMGAKIIDVGTGAGFPGIVMKIARPDIKLTLLDSLNKRLIFLREVCDELGLDAEIIHFRAEEAGRKKEYRENFDIATARAVARLNILSEYCLPFVKKDGYFISMKGPAAEEELKEAYVALKTLGAKAEGVKTETLPDGDKRSFVFIKKISQTPTQYPRISAKISKKPL